jgi:hypothetical protein
MFSLLIIFFISGCSDIIVDTFDWLEPEPKFTMFDFISLDPIQVAAAKRIREKTSIDLLADWKIVEMALPQPQLTRKHFFGPPLIQMTEDQIIQLLGSPSSFRSENGKKFLNFELGELNEKHTMIVLVIKEYYIYSGKVWKTILKESNNPESVITNSLNVSSNAKMISLVKKKSKKKSKKIRN